MDVHGFYQDHSYAPLAYAIIRFEKALDLLAGLSGVQKVLDVGCGDGQFGERLIGKGKRVWGMDINEKALDAARKKGIKVKEADLESVFPFKKSFFDAVFAGEIIEYIFDTDRFLGEVARVLRPGGYAVVTTPNLASLNNRTRLFFGAYPHAACDFRASKGHIRQYTFKVLERQMASHGLHVVRRRTNNLPFPILSRAPSILKRLAITLGDVVPTWGGQIIVLAQKR